MSEIAVRFDTYIAQYPTSYFSETAYSCIDQCRKISKAVKKTFTQLTEIPKMVHGIVSWSIEIIEFIKTDFINIAFAKQVLKEINDLLQLSKSSATFQGICHLRMALKSIALTLAGIVLTTLSTLGLLAKFKLFNMESLKITLAALPVIGILPFGGLLAISIAVLRLCSCISSHQSRSRLIEQQSLQEKKLNHWQSIDQEGQIIAKQESLSGKHVKLVEEFLGYTELLQEGTRRLEGADPLSFENHRLQIAKKDIEAMLDTITLKMEKYGAKILLWNGLARDQADLEVTKQSKIKKWEAKIAFSKDKLHAHNVTTAVKVADLAASVFGIFIPILGIGLKVLPVLSKVLDALSLSCSIWSWKLNRQLAN